MRPRRKYGNERDANEPEIVEALQDAGCLVRRQHEYDLIVARGKMVYMLEVKSATGKNTKLQDKLLAQGWPLQIVRTPQEALKAIGL